MGGLIHFSVAFCYRRTSSTTWNMIDRRSNNNPTGYLSVCKNDLVQDLRCIKEVSSHTSSVSYHIKYQVKEQS